MININDKLDYSENINSENELKDFNDLDTLLKKKNLNKKICILDYSNIKLCKNKGYYIVKPTINLNNSNFNEIINNLELGSIVLIDDNFSLDNFKLFLKKVNSMDLKIVYLSEIIQE